VFKGTYRHKIDPKGRVPVPAAFRKASPESPVFVVTLFDQCLAAYPRAEWERLEEQLRALPAFNRGVKALTRILASRATDCEIDGQGRIRLPVELRAAAHLGREALVVGVLNRFEIWAPDAWESFLRESETLLDEASLEVPWPLPTGPAGGPRSGPSGPGNPQGKPSR
jgi:MraZ protein